MHNRLLVLSLCLCFAAAMSGAQARDTRFKTSRDPLALHHAPAVPLAAKQRGCIKSCDSDLSPCDTPLDKRLDGRCSL